MREVVYYQTAGGESPFAVWLASLDDRTAARIATTVRRMELGNFGDSKGVGGGVMERRLTFGPGYRLYYGQDGGTIVVLLIGGTKQRQSRDIAKAKEYWADYLEGRSDD